MMTDRYYRLDRKNIAIVQFIIEGYDGMAMVTTVDPHLACLCVSVVQSQLDDFDLLAEDLRETYSLIPCSPPGNNDVKEE
ncbi:MAG: DUF4911 domain-containing protein [Syntrophobacterales bacterium]|jgi:hypothetical protein|nr:DUF4911 domain-containing protein [Syntrophobacterales bacterium]